MRGSCRQVSNRIAIPSCSLLPWNSNVITLTGQLDEVVHHKSVISMTLVWPCGVGRRSSRHRSGFIHYEDGADLRRNLLHEAAIQPSHNAKNRNGREHHTRQHLRRIRSRREQTKREAGSKSNKRGKDDADASGPAPAKARKGRRGEALPPASEKRPTSSDKEDAREREARTETRAEE